MINTCRDDFARPEAGGRLCDIASGMTGAADWCGTRGSYIPQIAPCLPASESGGPNERRKAEMNTTQSRKFQALKLSLRQLNHYSCCLPHKHKRSQFMLPIWTFDEAYASWMLLDVHAACLEVRVAYLIG
jgi:hypothetical protein